VVVTEKAAAVYQRGRWLVSNVSDVRIMWNITAVVVVDGDGDGGSGGDGGDNNDENDKAVKIVEMVKTVKDVADDGEQMVRE
jgi:hypothetical protein